MNHEPPEDFISIHCRGYLCDTILEIPFSALNEALKANNCSTLRQLCNSFVCNPCMAEFIIMVEESVLFLPPEPS